MEKKLSELIEEFIDYKFNIKHKEEELQYFKKKEQGQRQAEIDVVKIKKDDVGKKIDEHKIAQAP